jgi:hypothetical protein
MWVKLGVGGVGVGWGLSSLPPALNHFKILDTYNFKLIILIHVFYIYIFLLGSQRAVRSLKHIFGKFDKNARCLRTRLYALTHQNKMNRLRYMSQQYSRPQRRRSFQDDFDNEVNSLDDCIEGIEEPLYGFRTNVTLLQDSPCVLGVTCRNFALSEFTHFYCFCDPRKAFWGTRVSLFIFLQANTRKNINKTD